MKITGTAIKLGAFSLVLLLFTAIIIVVFGQMRFDRTTGYSAIFSNASGLRAGQFVRASGVEVGKVSKVELHRRRIAGARSTSTWTASLPLFEGTTASIRYLNLIGDRYMELKRGDSDKRLPAGGTIPLERTEPALDLDALIGGFRPLFRALDPDKVNNIAQSIITIFQGQGGTINDILDQTASLTSALADRDQAIGEVIQQPEHRAGHHRQAPAAVRRDRAELREADHRAEEPEPTRSPARSPTSATPRAPSPICSPTTARCCRAPSAISEASSSRSSTRRTSSTTS